MQNSRHDYDSTQSENNNDFYDNSHRMRISSSEKKVFKAVNRKREDELVRQYRETGDVSILDELFEIREPTLWVWARKFSYLENLDDMFGEFSVVWLNCVNKYEYEAEIRPVRTKDGGLVYDENGKIKTVLKRTPFNTYLFTALRNRAWNILKKKHSKRNCDEEGKPVSDTMKSLDFAYSDEGEDSTMHDFLKGEDGDSIVSPMQVEQIIDSVAGNDHEVRQAMETFVSRKHLRHLSSACKLACGELRINKQDRKTLLSGGDVGVELLKDLLCSTGRYPKGFKVVSYAVYPSKVSYELTLKGKSNLIRRMKDAVDASRERLAL